MLTLFSNINNVDQGVQIEEGFEVDVASDIEDESFLGRLCDALNEGDFNALHAVEEVRREPPFSSRDAVCRRTLRLCVAAILLRQ